MKKYFFKGESLNIVFATPIVEAPAVRQTITGYDIQATIQGLIPVVEALDEYTFKLFLPEALSLKLTATDAPIVIIMRKDGTTKIGRNMDLNCVDPKFALPEEQLDDPGQMVLNMGASPITFTLDLKQVPLSPFEMWLVNNPEGTQAQFLAFLQKPATDFVQTFTDAMANKEDVANKIDEMPEGDPTGDEYIGLTLLRTELAKKEDAANKVSEIPAEPTGEEFPDLALMQTELAKKPDIAAPVPATATSAGVAGQIVIGGGYIYHCVAANTWERAALVTATWE